MHLCSAMADLINNSINIKSVFMNKQFQRLNSENCELQIGICLSTLSNAIDNHSAITFPLLIHLSLSFLDYVASNNDMIDLCFGEEMAEMFSVSRYR
jgi:hypothetical protein